MTGKIYSLDEIKKMLAKVASEYDVEKIYLFGSYARGEATEKKYYQNTVLMSLLQ